MTEALHRYRSDEEDSARWAEFGFRRGDIIISTRSKSGTTWMQMICALLVFQQPDLPAPLSVLSPWLDWLTTPRDEVFAALEAQQHRRFIKTHTPLDGLPQRPEVSYVVVARQPLDMAVSLYYQSQNLDRARVAELTGKPISVPPPTRPLGQWLQAWIESEADPQDRLDSFPGVMRHLSGAWARRHESNMILVHYDDLQRNLSAEMRRIADRLGIAVPGDVWPALVEAATFEQMRSRADLLAPDSRGVLKSKQAFFRQGSSGTGRSLLTPGQEARYLERAHQLATPDLVTWLHADRTR